VIVYYPAIVSLIAEIEQQFKKQLRSADCNCQHYVWEGL